MVVMTLVTLTSSTQVKVTSSI